jgi:POT family proton-dependent oligopeptide transporter
MSEKQFFGHPRGLATLFFTEMWERFSFYGGQALLILFMTAAVADGGMGMSAVTAASVYGLYTAGAYFLGLPGGWVADRLIGHRNAVLVGGLLIAAGNFSLATPGPVPFSLGLLLVVLGTGLLKPNVSAIVGELYPEGGARRDAGFSIFYMGINVGAFVAPLVCGFLGETINWHFGFAAAGIGMTLGTIQYRLGYRYLSDAGRLRDEARAGRPGALRKGLLGVGAVLAVAAAFTIATRAGVVGLGLEQAARATGVIIFAVALYFFGSILAFGGLETAEKKRVVVIFLLFVGAALFWAGFEQTGSSMNLFAYRLTDRNLLGWELPATWLQSVNPLFIIALSPVFGWLWVFLNTRRLEPPLPVKFGLGLVLLGAGFLVLAWGASYTVRGQLVSPAWLVTSYFLHTCGELAVSPVGLSSITKLSPKRYVGQMMGLWFMGAALGNLVAGLVGSLFETLALPTLFARVAIAVIVAGVFFVAFYKPIRNQMGGVR